MFLFLPFYEITYINYYTILFTVKNEQIKNREQFVRGF
ncbi:hypothetical protein LACWKB8_1497 [Lactobacillus sp. wkB8]|nr:hypothetical protein LACWKB8_1497 [Lactobacillus sp. wkB8]